MIASRFRTIKSHTRTPCLPLFLQEWRAENGLPDPTQPPRGTGRRLAGSGVVADVNNAVGRGGGGGGMGGSAGGGVSGDPFLSHLRAHGL